MFGGVVGIWTSVWATCGFWGLCSSAEAMGRTDWARRGTDVKIMVDYAAEHQCIDSFGASDAWSMQYVGLRPGEREWVAELLFDTEKGIGLSGWRFNLGAGKAGPEERPWISNPWREVESFLTQYASSSRGGLGTFTYDFEGRNRGAVWFLKEAHRRGVNTFTAFLNSPPRPFTRNGQTNLGRLPDTSNLRPGFEPQLARYIVDVLEHFDKAGLPFDYVSPFNEPQWSWDAKSNQEGTPYSNEDLSRALKAIHKELSFRKPEFSHPPAIEVIDSGEILGLLELREDLTRSKGSPYGNYLSHFFDDPEISRMVASKISGHSYWSERALGDGEQLRSHRLRLRERLAKIRERIPGFEYWATEYCVLGGAYGEGGAGRDLGMAFPMQALRIMHHDLTIADASAWYFWTAVSKEDWKDGLLYVDENPGHDIVVPKMLWAMGNFSRFIRPGSVRLETQGADDPFGVMASAYRVHADKVAIVAINHPKYGGGNGRWTRLLGEDRMVSLGLRGLPEGRKVRDVEAFVTSPEDSLAPYPVPVAEDGTSFSYILPEWSVVTFVVSLR